MDDSHSPQWYVMISKAYNRRKKPNQGVEYKPTVTHTMLKERKEDAREPIARLPLQCRCQCFPHLLWR